MGGSPSIEVFGCTIAGGRIHTPARWSNDLKRLSQSEWLRRFGGFAGWAAPANVQLKCRHAASDNETNIPVSIFPKFVTFWR